VSRPPSRTARDRSRLFAVTAAAIGVLAGAGTLAIFYSTLTCEDVTGGVGTGFVGSPRVVWDEQALLSISVDSRSLYTNATVSAVEDKNGYGPAYLLNGATNVGYWYQAGLTYNWGVTGQTPGHYQGFSIITSVFSPNDSAVPRFAYIQPVAMESGKTIRIGLSLQSGCVTMSWTLPGGSTISERYDSYGASSFVNNSPIQEDAIPAYLSGLMTEWWHVDRYYGATAPAFYTLPKLDGSFVGLGVSEFIPGTAGSQLFANSTQAHLGCDCTTTLSYQNVTETVSWSGFTTG
jgi:hypothetical protein